MPPEAMKFVDSAGSNVGVWLSSAAVESMLTTARKAGKRETGGILIGRYDPDGWMAEVVEATPKPRGSKSGWWWFTRSNSGLAALLERRWNEGYYYLGEWHFHPGGAPTPSERDKRSMQRISSDPAYQCPQPILVILGGTIDATWNVSVTVFNPGTPISLTNGACATFATSS